MKVSEFKKILKPLIEQTVKEVLLHEGVLSNIVSEVAAGLQKPLVETRKIKTEAADAALAKQEYEQQRKQRIKKLNESAKFQNANIFEGVEEIPESSGSGTSPLSGVSPTDAGVDISGIQTIAKGKWKKLAGGQDV